MASIDEKLTAFVVLNSRETLTESAMLSYCQQRLPSVLVPERVIFLPELPRNFAGKVLRRQLPSLTQAS